MSQSLREMVQDLSLTVTSMLTDAEKTEAGNKAAATRLRKSALELTKTLKSLRSRTSEVRNERDAERKASVHA